jgi:hypothetical protein
VDRSTLDFALAYLRAGFSLIPIRRDGTKAPAWQLLPTAWDEAACRGKATWKPFQESPPPEEEVRRWFSLPQPPGVAIVCGAVSRGMELLDFDHHADACLAAWRASVAADAPGLLDRVSVVRTPRRPPGYHVRWLCPDTDVPGNRNLALDADGAMVLVQTRGEGGYALAPGCPAACHETGNTYDPESGPAPEHLAPVSVEERDLLVRCALLLDRRTAPEPPPPSAALPGGLRPGEDYDRRGPDWAEVLAPHGWTLVATLAGGERRWLRPGKAHGWSATTGVCHGPQGEDLLKVFTSSAPPLRPGPPYGKFRAYALLNHNGDFTAAARDLARLGFGTAPRPRQDSAPRGQTRPPSVADLVRGTLSRVEFVGHDQLLDSVLPPLRWLVDGLIPDEGLTFLGGKKKLGKSWLCLQVAQAISRGLPCLGRATVQGPVIYVCLEDGRRRLKQRLLKQSAPHGLPITYYTRFPPLDGDGMGELVTLLDRDRPRMLILDTLAAAKTGKTEENAAGPMADLANGLRAVSQHFALGTVVVAHHGKLVGGDPGDDLRGSSALGGAGDVNLGLYRTDGQYTLKGEGRDLDNFSLRLAFDPQSWSWSVVGDSRQLAQQQADDETTAAVRALGEADAQAIAAAMGKSRANVSRRLLELANAGVLLCRLLPPEEGQGGRPKILYRVAPRVAPEDDADDWPD